MQDAVVYQCRCPHCRQAESHSEQQAHRQLNLVLSRLDEQQRRWVVALESKRLGHGGDVQMALVTGMHLETIRRGRQELDDDLEGRPTDRVRLPGAGRPRVEKKIPLSSAISLG
jgi:hypothetical protein